MQFDRKMYDAQEKEQMNFLVHLYNKANPIERILLEKVMQTVSAHYMSKRLIIDAHNHNDRLYIKPNYEEL